jgi:phosphoglycerate dehydrogenase-like enzyme
VKVAILDDIHHAYEGTSGVHRLREHAEVHIFTVPFGDVRALHSFDALVANRERTRFTRDLLERLPNLRIIAQTGNHAQHIDLAAAAERNIVVARASGGFSVGAAELAIGLAIALMRQIPASHEAIKRGEWPVPTTSVLHGKTLGIVGLGRVGQHVARLGAAFGMRVVAWSPRLTDVTANAANVERRTLEQLLQESDVVSIHATLTSESRGLLDARRIALMKSTAYVINTARGPIVDQAALVEALTEKRIAGAGLDVFDEEPLPAAHPLTKLANVVLTPHIGWPTDEGYARFSEAACDVLLAYQAGREVPRFTV